MEITSNIKQKIHHSNAEFHDFWADTHDTNVPYITRKTTRKYYWDLIESNIVLSGNTIKAADVLEVGCGTGTFTDIFVNKGAKSFTGIDLSAKMIEKAKLKAERHQYSTPVNFYVDSLENFALNNENKFDIIQSSSFIHHLSDIDEGMRLIKYMLKPGGVYIGIHEEINDFIKTKVNKLDDQLQYLFGYGGSKIIARNERIKGTIKFFLRPVISLFKGILSGRIFRKPKGNMPAANQQSISNETYINYVDYQLNENFSLSRTCAQYGIVKPYCYLGFPELMVFGRPDNFEMLVMKK